MNWKPVRIKLRDLKPWEKNPRRISKHRAERLLRSFNEFGQVQTIAIGPNNEVYDGHQRLSVLRAAYGDDYEVIALQCNTQLDERQRARLAALLNGAAAGEWDVELLRNLLNEEFGSLFNSDDAKIESRLAKSLRKELSIVKDEYPYTLNTCGLIYEPTGRKVSLRELYNTTEYRRCLEIVENTNVSDDEREFLRLAATRYLDFDFAAIAEYYAQASPEFQRAAEQLGLVIVDMDDAIRRAIFVFDERIRKIVAMQKGRNRNGDEE